MPAFIWEATEMPLKEEKTRITDELLEWLWVAESEDAALTRDELLARASLSSEDWENAGIIQSGFASVDANGTLHLTEAGREHGRRIVRRHRLAERLLADVLHMSEPTEETACRFEHAIDHDVAEHICTLLGHPATCPHDRPIPPGRCCQRQQAVLPSIMKRLSELRPGERGTVAYVTMSDARAMDRLAAIGIVPGAEVAVHQERPGFVLRMGATEVALDVETVAGIFVRVKGADKAPPELSGRHRFRFWGGRGV